MAANQRLDSLSQSFASWNRLDAELRRHQRVGEVDENATGHTTCRKECHNIGVANVSKPFTDPADGPCGDRS